MKSKIEFGEKQITVPVIFRQAVVAELRGSAAGWTCKAHAEAAAQVGGKTWEKLRTAKSETRRAIQAYFDDIHRIAEEKFLKNQGDLEFVEPAPVPEPSKQPAKKAAAKKK